MARQLLTFSILGLIFDKQQQQQQQQQQPQQQQQQQQQPQQQQQLQEKEEKKTVVKKKLIIKPKVSHVSDSVDAVVPIPENQNQIQDSSQETKETSHSKTKTKIVIKIRKPTYKNKTDIAPPATVYCSVQKNDIYPTPPPNCCRFFIENRHCFLRQRDNACICPKLRTVIGFWNEKVGKDCKLLPIEDETVYEEASTVDPPSQTAPLPTSPKKIDTFTTESPSKISNCKHSVSKPKNVSDAQRARIASEPVALLREKLAKQYGIAKKN